MPRPSEVTREDVLRWRPRWEEWTKEEPPFRRTPHWRESFFAGEWLEEKLLALGMEEGARKDARFANDQKCCELPDPWAASVETLQECLDGRPPRPGRETGDRLMRRTGRNESLIAILRNFVRLGYPPEYVEELMDQHRMEPMRPIPPLPEGRHAHLFADLRRQAVVAPNKTVDQLMTLYRRLWRQDHDAR